MNLDKISLTLFDFVGFLLPGFVVVFGLSLIEASFLQTSFLAGARVGENVLLFTILAYFLGQAVHTLANRLKDRFPRAFTDHRKRLKPYLMDRVQRGVAELYRFEPAQAAKLTSLDTYMIAASYVTASDKTGDREVLQAREGFHKSSMVAFGFLTLVLIVTLFRSGAQLQLEPGTRTAVPLVTTLVLALLSLGLTILFWRGFLFYNRVKINNTLIQFLSQFEMDKRKQGP